MLSKKKKEIMEVIMLTVLMVLVIFTPENSIKADGTRDKAIQSYNNLMSKKTINWGDEELNTDLCEYYMINLDNDDVPEMMVYSDQASFAEGKYRLYTYIDGKAKKVGELRSLASYYPKTGVLCTGDIRFGAENTTYYKLENGKLRVVFSYYNDYEKDEEFYYDSKDQKITKETFDDLYNMYIGNIKYADFKISQYNKIEKWLKNKESWGVLGYLDYMSTFRPCKDSKALRTDMATYLAWNSLNSKSSGHYQEGKYSSYTGIIAKSSTANKNKIKKAGTKLFGKDFKLSYSSKIYTFFEISKDKKYILCNCPDTGDYWTNGGITSMYTQNGCYVVKYIDRCYCAEDHTEDYIYTITLKKTGNSYVIKSIKGKTNKF